LGRQPISTAASGTHAAWIFQTGDLKVTDSITKQEWSFKLPERALCAFFIPPGDKLLTCGRTELRLWTVTSDAPSIVAQLPSPAFHIISGPKGSRLLDSDDGGVHLVSRDFSDIRLLHKHSALSFGVAWCDSLACSISWDGRVLCSNLNESNTETLGSFNAPIRAIGSYAEHCFIASSAGGIYDLRHPNEPLYKHTREPYRLAVSNNGSFLASGDWSGSVIVWDIAKQRLAAHLPHLQTDLITALSWTDSNQLIAGGLDGNVTVLEPDLVSRHTWNLNEPVRSISYSHSSIYILTSRGTIHQLLPDRTLKRSYALGITPTAFATTSDHEYLAIGSNEGEIFIIKAAQYIAVKRFDRGSIQCVQFEHHQMLLTCTLDGAVLQLELDKQHFEPLKSGTIHEEDRHSQ